MPSASGRLAVRFLVAIAAADAVLIVLNAGGTPATSFLAFDEERNFTTWYSSAKLLLTALVAFACARREPADGGDGRRTRRFWYVLAMLFATLSMDETATAHERLAASLLEGSFGQALRARFAGGDAAKDAFLWPILFAPVVVAMLYFLVAFLWGRLRHDRRMLALALGGAALFAVAVVLEGPAVYQSSPVSTWGAAEIARYRWFSFGEESAEVIGATMMLAALVGHLCATEERSPPGS